MIRKFYYSHPDMNLGGYCHYIEEPIHNIKVGQKYNGVSPDEVIYIDGISGSNVKYSTYRKGILAFSGTTSINDIRTCIESGTWTLVPDPIKKPIRKMKDAIDYTGSLAKNDDMKEKQIIDGILAAVKITNGNLINMERKLKYRRMKFQAVDRILLQSESLAIFKGNIIRIFKQIYNSHDINRIKRAISFVLDLDDEYPLVSDVRVTWLDNIEYMSDQMTHIKQEISNAFASITIDQIQEQSIAAMIEYAPEETGTSISTTLTFKDINFEKIQNIKFA